MRSPSDYSWELKPPGLSSDFSLDLKARNVNDQHRLRAYVKLTHSTGIKPFRLYEKANYARGPHDEIYVTAVNLDQAVFFDLALYIRGQIFDTPITASLVSEDGVTLVSEHGYPLVTELSLN